jgi:hypothetical protein
MQLQDYLFRQIKERLPDTESLPERVAELLHISNDSAYRRIRGGTPLVLEEARILCEAFNISLDELFKVKKDAVLFVPTQLNNKDYGFDQFLKDILANLKKVASFNNKQLIYMAKDLPLFHHFLYRPLFAFRYFFWMKSVLQHPDFEHVKFSMDRLTPETEKLGREILSIYNEIPSVEIWNSECVNSTIAQVEYYKEAGYFNNEKDIAEIYEALRQTIAHVREQAEQGVKFLLSETASLKKENFYFYHNRFILGDNTIMVLTEGRKTLYINYDILNYMVTHDESFCNNVYNKLQMIMKRSTIISSVSEKHRHIFFNLLNRKIPSN